MSSTTDPSGPDSGLSLAGRQPDIIEDTVLLQDGESTGSSVIEPNSVAWKDGRTYHGYDEGQYLLPNDGPEQDRLDLQHAMSTLMIDRRFGLAPFTAAPTRVLDIATGTGIWVLEFARQNPRSHVVGTDLSLIQPHDVPNCEFIRENSETSEWIFPYFFDYIHCRYCVSCFDEPMVVMRKAWSHLQPGGWIEFYDPTTEVFFDGGTGANSAWAELSAAVDQSLRSMGRDPNKARLYKDWIEQVGFVDVTETVIPCPFSPWPADDKNKRIGMFARADWRALLKGGSRFLAAAGMSIDETRSLAERCMKELDEEKVCAYYKFYVVCGRKPSEQEMTVEQRADWTRMQKVVEDMSAAGTDQSA